MSKMKALEERIKRIELELMPVFNPYPQDDWRHDSHESLIRDSRLAKLDILASKPKKENK